MEEEYQVVDVATWELRSTIRAILEKDREDGREDVRAEFLQSQIEASTSICNTVGELYAEVCRMRGQVAALSRELGLAVIAAGTHPFSPWTDQQVTPGERYALLEHELQDAGRRLVSFGLHIHVGIADLDQRILVMNRLRPYMPLLLALSTSSPFFDGRLTGLHSYRTTLLAALPRSGIPPYFSSWADYQQGVKQLLHAGWLNDRGSLWWDIRPNPRVPTVEVRVPDMPSRAEETVCLAAWVQALAVKLSRERLAHPVRRFFIEAGKWHAARYGLGAHLLLPMEESPLTVRECVGVLGEWLADVVDELGSGDAFRSVERILADGTSADRQVHVWRESGSLQAVLAHLARETTLFNASE